MQYKLKNIKLFNKTEPKNKINKIHHLYVSTNRSYQALRNDTVEHILNYLEEWLDPTECILLKPLEQLSDSVKDNKK